MTSFAPYAVILPDDEQLVSIALATARRLGLVLQTNGEHCVMAPRVLRGFGRIAGGGAIDRTPPEAPEAA